MLFIIFSNHGTKLFIIHGLVFEKKLGPKQVVNLRTEYSLLLYYFPYQIMQIA